MAGPKESKVPGIHDLAAQFLKELLMRAISDEGEVLEIDKDALKMALKG